MKGTEAWKQHGKPSREEISRGFSRPRDRSLVSYIAGRFFHHLSHQGCPN